MHTKVIKVVCSKGQEAETEQAIAKYVKAAEFNPGFIHGIWWQPEPTPSGSTPTGFSIREREQTYFLYLAFQSARDMLRHVELYNDGNALLPVPHDYMLGSFKEGADIDVENRYV
ncbi:MAG: hypothetical protein ACYTDT_05180 [Planctomycetota bacterium]|jgi:hypothetical protein